MIRKCSHKICERQPPENVWMESACLKSAAFYPNIVGLLYGLNAAPCYCPPDKVLVTATTMWGSVFTGSAVVFQLDTVCGRLFLRLCESAAPFPPHKRIRPPKKNSSVICLISTCVSWVWIQRRIHSARKIMGIASSPL